MAVLQTKDSKLKDKRNSQINIGNFIVIDKILEEYKIKEKLKRTLDEDDYGLFLDLVACSIIEEKEKTQHYISYAKNHILYSNDMHIYDESKISSLLNKITKEHQEEFFNLWNDGDLIKKDEKIRILYDTTNKEIQSGNIKIDTFEDGNSSVRADTITYSLAFNESNKIPVCIKKYDNPIIDISNVKSTMDNLKSYGYNNFSFIFDRGYLSIDVIEYLVEALPH